MVNATEFMERALFLAERGRGRTTPNPLVGAVVVSPDGVVVGQGAHLVAGGPHAEVVALDDAGSRARGATLYCTLEPCSHTGRTGPCVERIAAAGIARVVAAVTDPNPRVSGRGFAFLRARGIEVVEDVERDRATRQNAPFFTWIARGRPLVTLKAAVSADGFVGARDRRVHLTGAAANRFLHRERAEFDAIAVGSGTVLTDDPLLTARVAYRYRPLTRVIFDWRTRVPATARVFSTLGEGPVIMIVSAGRLRASASASQALDRLQAQGVTVQAFPEVALRPVVEWLGTREILSLLVEGGPALHDRFLEAGLADRVQWVVTPGRLEQGVPIGETPRGALWSTLPRTRVLGEDTLIEFDVHRPH
jgi:diaminohydroxyphosphoribosylaminopyrimidine deaminase/5-amino-6-(5-phosphoribosylamino)uracil reductase